MDSRRRLTLSRITPPPRPAGNIGEPPAPAEGAQNVIRRLGNVGDLRKIAQQRALARRKAGTRP